MTTMENEKKEIARIAKKYAKVQNLMKYVNQDTLKEMYKRQPKNKAVGTYGMTKEAYGENLDENIEKLLKDMK